MSDIWDEPVAVDYEEVKRLPGETTGGPSLLPPDAVKDALWACNGNIGHAAKRLGVPFDLVWRTIKANPELNDDIEGAREKLVSIAEEAVYEALHDYDDIKRKDAMARFVIGRKDKQASASKLSSINVATSSGSIRVVWGDGQAVAGGDGE